MTQQGGDQWGQSGGQPGGWGSEGQGGFGQQPQYGGGDQYGGGGDQFGAQYGSTPQYGADQYGTPQYGTGGGGYGAPPQKTNVLAIVALVLAIACGPIGLILGIVALVQTNKTGQKGKGLAIAATIIGAISLLLWLVFAIPAWRAATAPTTTSGTATSSSSSTSDTSSDTTSDSPSTDTVDAFSIKIGDCFLDPNVSQVSSLEIVPCSQPHFAEAFHKFDLTDATMPDEELMKQRASDGCTPAFDAFIGKTYNESALDYYYFTPTTESWASGDREILCAVLDPAGDTTGSLAGANR